MVIWRNLDAGVAARLIKVLAARLGGQAEKPATTKPSAAKDG